MSTLAKPARRGRKAPKPIRRRAPLPKRSSRPRAVRASEAGRIIARADREWSARVRGFSVYCQRLCGELATDPHHLKGRAASVRWLVSGGAHLCRRCHDVVQHSPALNAALGRQLLGDDGWEALELLAKVRVRRVEAAQKFLALLAAVAADVASAQQEG